MTGIVHVRVRGEVWTMLHLHSDVSLKVDHLLVEEHQGSYNI